MRLSALRYADYGLNAYIGTPAGQFNVANTFAQPLRKRPLNLFGSISGRRKLRSANRRIKSC